MERIKGKKVNLTGDNIKKKNTHTSFSLSFSPFSGLNLNFSRQNQELGINPNDKKVSKSVEKKVQQKSKKMKSVHQYVSKNFFIGYQQKEKVWKVFCKYENNSIEISIGTHYFTKNQNKCIALSSESLNRALSLLKSEILKNIENDHE